MPICSYKTQTCVFVVLNLSLCADYGCIMTVVVAAIVKGVKRGIC
jgi:hypothetical protein